MALVKRHWKLALFNCILLLIGAVMLTSWLLRSRTTAIAQEAPPANPPANIDLSTYTRVQAVRDRLALTTRDLAAFGCSQQQATDVLTAVLQWCSSNAEQLSQLEQTERTAQQQLADAVRSVAAGPKNETVLGQAKTLQAQALAASKQRQTLMDGAVATLQNSLTANQQQTWQIARTNRAAPQRYRYLSDLSAQSSAALSAVAAKYGAGSPQALAKEASVLGARVNEVNTSIANAAEHAAAVIAAETSVLPTPQELRSQLALPSIQ